MKALHMGHFSILYNCLNIMTFSIIFLPQINDNINWNNISHK